MILITSPRFGAHVTPPGHPERIERAEVFDRVAADWAARGGARCRAATRRRARSSRASTARSTSTTIEATAGRAVDARRRHVHVARVGRKSRCWRRARPSSAVDHALDARRAGVRAGAAAGASRRARPRDGLLPLQQRRGRRGARARPRARRASRSSTSTCITATARSGSSTTIRASSTSPATSSRSTRAPAPPTKSGRARARGFTVNVPLEAGADGRRLRAGVQRGRASGARSSSRPELVIVSAGFDAHERDPLASMRVTTARLRARSCRRCTAWRGEAARSRSSPKAATTCSALGECLEASFASLEGPPPWTR